MGAAGLSELLSLKGAKVSSKLSSILESTFNKDFKFPKLTMKYSKHAVIGEEWGFKMSRSVYKKMANILANAPVRDYIYSFTSKQGTIFKYNKITNEFLTINANGAIETFFRPKQGYNYYLKQIEIYGGE